MSTSIVIIRNGSYFCGIILDRIAEWPAANWKGVMLQMAKGGRSNDETVEYLSEWFPEAIRDAKNAFDEAIREYKRKFKTYKQIARQSEWEAQKLLNAELNLALRSASRRYETLKSNYKHFLAAKASMKKEN